MGRWKIQNGLSENEFSQNFIFFAEKKILFKVSNIKILTLFIVYISTSFILQKNT